MGNNDRFRWNLFRQQQQTPVEFLCPISKSLMSDPVFVSSGQTFERVCVQVCLDLGFVPKLDPPPDFSTIIANINMKSSIDGWCDSVGFTRPQPPEYSDVENDLRRYMPSEIEFREQELFRAVADQSPYEINTISHHHPQEEEEVIYHKLKSVEMFDQEEGLIMMRNATHARVSLCSPRILSLIKNMVVSRYSLVQIKSLASLVNLSLEKMNKLTIVRLGFVPLLIDVLKFGNEEAQEHAAGAIFSLSIEDYTKPVFGILGGLQPLLDAFRTGQTVRTRYYSSMALDHLSLDHSNRLKLLRIGAVLALLSMVSSGEPASRALMVICNLACCSEGRSAMLEGNAVAVLVGKLREEPTETTEEVAVERESCVAALFALSHEGFRFVRLAKEARAVQVLKQEEERGTERAREKAKKILRLMIPEDEDEEELIDWDRIIYSNVSGFRVG